MKRQAGFSMPELIVAMAIMALLFVGLFAGLIQVYHDSSYSAQQVIINANAQTAMNQIEQDVRYSTTFDSSLASKYTDPYGSNNNKTTPTAWTIAGNPASTTTRAIILETNATTANTQSSLRAFVYTATPYACGQEIYNAPLKYTIVYFLSGGSLYRRIITDTTTPTCNNTTEIQAQKQSCPSSQSATWPAICKANDEVIVPNVVSLSVDYYDLSNNLLSVYPSDSTGLLPIAAVAKVTLVLGDGKANHISSTISLGIRQIN